jgi:hypothetical protein
MKFYMLPAAGLGYFSLAAIRNRPVGPADGPREHGVARGPALRPDDADALRPCAGGNIYDYPLY